MKKKLLVGVISVFLLATGCFNETKKVERSATMWMSESFIVAVPDFFFSREEEKRVNIFLNTLFTLQEGKGLLKRKYTIYLFPSLFSLEPEKRIDKIIGIIEEFLDMEVEEKNWIKGKIKENGIIGRIFGGEDDNGLIFTIPDKSSERIREAASVIYEELTDAEKGNKISF